MSNVKNFQKPLKTWKVKNKVTCYLLKNEFSTFCTLDALSNEFSTNQRQFTLDIADPVFRCIFCVRDFFQHIWTSSASIAFVKNFQVITNEWSWQLISFPEDYLPHITLVNIADTTQLHHQQQLPSLSLPLCLWPRADSSKRHIK